MHTLVATTAHCIIIQGIWLRKLDKKNKPPHSVAPLASQPMK